MTCPPPPCRYWQVDPARYSMSPTAGSTATRARSDTPSRPQCSARPRVRKFREHIGYVWCGFDGDRLVELHSVTIVKPLDTVGTLVSGCWKRNKEKNSLRRTFCGTQISD